MSSTDTLLFFPPQGGLAGGGSGGGGSGIGNKFTSNGGGTTFTIAHGLGVVPTFVEVGAGSTDARGTFSWTADATNITVTYPVATPSGTNNIVLWWTAGTLSSPIAINGGNTVAGTATQSGNASTTVFTIPHGLASTPSNVVVEPNSTDARGGFTWTVGATNIVITYQVAPPSGTNNLTWNWVAAFNTSISGFTTSSTDTLLNKTIDASLNTVKNASAGVYYHIFKSGSNYIALNKATGIIDSSNTDAYTTIQAAINNIGSNPTKGKIFLDTQGVVWSLSNSLTAVTSLHLLGAGWQNTQLRAGGNYPALIIPNVNFVTLQDIFWTHNTPGYSTSLVQMKTGASGNKIADCQFYDFGNKAGNAIEFLQDSAAAAGLGQQYNVISRCYSLGFTNGLLFTVNNSSNYINGTLISDSIFNGCQHLATSNGATGSTVAQTVFSNVETQNETLQGNPYVNPLINFDDNNTDHSNTRILDCTFFDVANTAGVNVINVNSNTSLHYNHNVPDLYGFIGGSGATSIKIFQPLNVVKSLDSLGRRMGYWGMGYNGNAGVAGAVDSNGLFANAINLIASVGSRAFDNTLVNGLYLAVQTAALTTPKGFNVLPYFISQFNPRIDLKMKLVQTAKTRTGFFVTSATTAPATGADPLNARDGVGWYFDGTSVTDSTHWNSIHNGGTGASVIDPLDGTSGKLLVTADTNQHVLSIMTSDQGVSWQISIDGGTPYSVASAFARTSVGLGLWVYMENPTDTTALTWNLYHIKTSQDK